MYLPSLARISLCGKRFVRTTQKEENEKEERSRKDKTKKREKGEFLHVNLFILGYVWFGTAGLKLCRDEAGGIQAKEIVLV